MPPNGEHASNLEVCYKIYDSYAKDMTPIMLECASYCKVATTPIQERCNFATDYTS